MTHTTKTPSGGKAAVERKAKSRNAKTNTNRLNASRNQTGRCVQSADDASKSTPSRFTVGFFARRLVALLVLIGIVCCLLSAVSYFWSGAVRKYRGLCCKATSMSAK